MSNANNPIEIIRNNLICEDELLSEKFIKHIKHLYQYDLFKPILDLVATKSLQGIFKFKVQDKKVFDIDAGNCKTISTDLLDSIFNQFRSSKSYLVTIKKINYDVIVHEIGHMIEHELELDLTIFSNIISEEINKKTNFLTISEVIKDIMINQIAKYPQDQQNSELFARYFQLFALSKEISGYEVDSGYKLKNLENYLVKTYTWIHDNVYSKLKDKIDQNIASYSKKFLKSIDDVQHKWSEQKAKPIHRQKRVAWSGTVKSIKSDQF